MEIAYWEPDDSHDNTRSNIIQAKFSRGRIVKVTKALDFGMYFYLSNADFNLIMSAYNPISWSFGMPGHSLKFYTNGMIIAKAWGLSNALIYLELELKYKDNKKIIFKNKY